MTSPYDQVEYAPEPFNILNANSLWSRFSELFERFPVVLDETKLEFIQEEFMKRNIRHWRPSAVEHLESRPGILCECGEQVGRIFKRLELKSDGAKRNRCYHIPADILKHPLSSGEWRQYVNVPVWNNFMNEEWI